MEIFEPYSHSIAVLALWGLMVQVLVMLTMKGRTDEDRAICGNIIRDYSNPVYRQSRAFWNAMEISPLFVTGTIACILSGADPLRVNILTSVFLVARIVMAFVHIKTENQKLRSLTFMVGWVAALALGITGFVNAVL
ncbi:MAPEG family protein [Sulfitobacter sp. HNIBRBA2951]|uniref:MAPEG family protein n=1 Tax=Sulfitobacter aquimarinus TaxID=3158557 RepID=UPI0032DFF4FE